MKLVWVTTDSPYEQNPVSVIQVLLLYKNIVFIEIEKSILLKIFILVVAYMQ